MNINVANVPLDYQTCIWWLDYHQMWVTTDNTRSIYSWDLVAERRGLIIEANYYHGAVCDICELVHLKVSIFFCVRRLFVFIIIIFSLSK
jgi:hypothetical protein